MDCKAQTISFSGPQSVLRPNGSPTDSQGQERDNVPLVDLPQLTRSGRVVKKPGKFKDFVC